MEASIYSQMLLPNTEPPGTNYAGMSNKISPKFSKNDNTPTLTDITDAKKMYSREGWKKAY